MINLALAAITSLSPIAPQEAPSGQGQEPILSASDQKNLRAKLQKWLAAEEVYQEATGRDRMKASKKRLDAKDDFRDEWKAKSKKGDLLASMPDLQAIYENCFAVPKPKGGPGTLRKGKDVPGSDGKPLGYNYYLPKGYKPTTPVPMVLMFPGAAEDGKWSDGKRYFENTWLKTGAAGEMAFHIPTLPDNLEMDPTPDFSRDGQEAMEDRRIEAVFLAFGETFRQINVDRPRVYMDCGKGTSAFGLRFVSMFPDRFAGVVLRDPTAVEDVRLGSLLGIPVLMIKTAENGAVIDTLKQQLEAVTPDSVTVLDAADAYPFKASADAIYEWMGKQRRDMMRSRVVIEPNHNRFKNAYWVKVLTMNPIHTSTAENKPRIEVTADRATNRIVVKAQGIEDFELLLNDSLIDLSKEFTVVVNDKATTEQMSRDERGMLERVRQRRDWEFLFPVTYQSNVPK